MSGQPELTNFIDQQVDTYISSYTTALQAGLCLATALLCTGILLYAKCPLLVEQSTQEEHTYIRTDKILWWRSILLAAFVWWCCYRADYCLSIVNYAISFLYPAAPT